ncbi:hypothetical protein [Magnetospira sp. QH-2]|uniref:hypothetical protein n=1 Tax=Magnetospira sp. (strain QH-2) TaxID=1288970 RepID=UPI0003E815D5|nr:hypothetical protein [Magnetospira sp. QH-2]CCQ72710.1 conserved protein of unknown function [Magnetospira sp. QH-2]
MIYLVPIVFAAGWGIGTLAAKAGRKIASVSTKKLKPGKSMIHFAREIWEEEDEVILATEDIPLDNSHGATLLATDLYFTRSARTRIVVVRDRGSLSELSAEVFSLIRNQTEHYLKRTLGLNLEAEIERKIHLRLTAPPHGISHYRVLWKQTGLRGYYEVEIGQRFYQVPFLVTHGLSVSVDSLPGQPTAA